MGIVGTSHNCYNTWDLAADYSRRNDKDRLPILLWVGTKGFNYEFNLKYSTYLESLGIPGMKVNGIRRLVIPPELGYGESAGQRVMRLAALAADSGLDGVVCSALEAPGLRAARGPGFCLVTPGIRPAGDDPGDQRRVVSPAEAVALGSDYLVMGRPVTAAPDPLAALQRVHAELSA